MPTPRDIFQGRPPTVLTARPVNPNPRRPGPAASTTLSTHEDPKPAARTSFALRFTAAVLAADLHPNAERLAICLIDRANPRSGHIHDEGLLGVRTLASLTGLTDVQVKTSLEKLRRHGFIRRHRAAKGQPSRFRLRIPDTQQAPPDIRAGDQLR